MAFRLGIPPKLLDWKNNSMHAIDQWFQRVTDRLTMTIPTFRASASVAQVIASGVLTKVIFGNSSLDSAGYYNGVTSRYTPLIAGDYFFTAGVLMDYSAAPPAGLSTNAIVLLQNGVGITQANVAVPPNTIFQESVVSAVVSMNGTTDYIEIYMLQGSGVNRPTHGSTNTYFTGHLVRAL